MTQKYNFLLPAYKPDFFKEALDSILGQTYRDFKLIILDDCSPYDLKSIVDQYDDDRITYYRNEENMGGKSLVACWNKLLGFADSEYIILASDDDVYELNFLEEMDKLARKYPNVDLLRARVRRFDGFQTLEVDSVRKEYESQVEFLFNSCRVVQIPCIANYVFKLSSLKKEDGFYGLPLAWGSDELATLKLSKNGVAISRNIEFSFRWSGKNISTIENRKSLRKKLEARKQLCLFYQDFFNSVDTDGTLWQAKMLKYATVDYQKKTYESIFHYFQVLSFLEVLQLILFLKNHRLLHSRMEPFGLIKYWVKKKMAKDSIW